MIKHARITSTQLSLAAMLMAVAAAGSVTAADTTASATSTVVTPIAITKMADLSFGSFAAGAATGTVTISPNNARALSGGATGMGGTITAAQFDVTGQASSTYSINVTGTPLTNGSGGTMTFTPIADLTASAITTGNVTNGTLSAGGTQSIFVGGVLDVGVNQAAGNYTGTITATVNYN